jgi:gamma-glutamylputrescine oxidase
MARPSLSFWERETWFQDVDLLVIGAGIVGMSTAYHFKLSNPLAKVVVIDRSGIPLGASTRNAGFACFGSITELQEDIATHGEESILALVKFRYDGLKALRNILGDESIEYEQHGGTEIFTKENEQVMDLAIQDIPKFNKLLFPITGLKNTYVLKKQTSFASSYENIIVNQAEGQLNSGKMVLAWEKMCRSESVEFIYGLEVEGFLHSENGVVIQMKDGFEWKVKRAIVTTNGFAKQLLPTLEVFPARNQVLITKPVPNLPFQGAFHLDQGYFYFRNVGNRILLGGGRNLDKVNEATDEFGQTNLIQDALIKMLETMILPSFKPEIDLWWSGILGLGPEKRPIIEMVGPKLGVAVRMGGMGVAIGTLVGKKASELMGEC